MSGDAPDQQLVGFLVKYTPEVAAVATAALARMRKRLRGAVELRVRQLMARALQAAAKPLDGKGRRRMVIKSVSAKQRPRRPGV